MKRICIMLMTSIIFSGTILQAGFIEDEPAVISVVEAKQLSNKTPLKLEGFIIKCLKDDKYLFKDNSDNIQVVISKSAWRGIDVTPKTKILISGKVEKPLFFLKHKINVSKVELVRL